MTNAQQSRLTTVQREEWTTKLLETARAASEIVMRIYGEPDMGVEYKQYGAPVTRADKEANALIVARLSHDFPGVPIVSEESDPKSFEGFESAPVALFVDPLDGTGHYIDRNGEFSVMIGVAEEGRATIGVVVCPASAKGAYVGVEGVGAYLLREDGTRQPLEVSTMDNLARVRCATARGQGSRSIDAKLEGLGCKELVPVGSSGIRGIQIASGTLDAHAHPSRAFMKLWDTCAPEAIVRAAGGAFTDAKGRPFDYRGALAQGTGIVAACSALHREVIRRFVAIDQRTGGETLN